MVEKLTCRPLIPESVTTWLLDLVLGVLSVSWWSQCLGPLLIIQGQICTNSFVLCDPGHKYSSHIFHILSFVNTLPFLIFSFSSVAKHSNKPVKFYVCYCFFICLYSKVSLHFWIIQLVMCNVEPNTCVPWLKALLH